MNKFRQKIKEKLTGIITYIKPSYYDTLIINLRRIAYAEAWAETNNENTRLKVIMAFSKYLKTIKEIEDYTIICNTSNNINGGNILSADVYFIDKPTMRDYCIHTQVN